MTYFIISFSIFVGLAFWVVWKAKHRHDSARALLEARIEEYDAELKAMNAAIRDCKRSMGCCAYCARAGKMLDIVIADEATAEKRQ